MFARVQRFPPSCRPSPILAPTSTTCRRSVSSTVVLSAEGDDRGRGRPASDGAAREKTSSYWDWIKSPEGGLPYREPTQPRNWLGGQVPFPMNRSFKPPTPIADSLRTAIYQDYMSNPQENSVRSLAERHHLSIKRVDAILRLKGLEAHWIEQSKPLQTGFVAGMEQILGIEEVDVKRHDVTEADTLDEAEGNDRARLRYQRMFWEPVAEGSEPIMPSLLEQARIAQSRTAQATRDAKSDPKYVPRHDTPVAKVKVQYISKPGHATVKFVDVGGKFLDIRDQQKRIAASERRGRRKEKVRLRKAGSDRVAH